jgi:hypothetical protein
MQPPLWGVLYIQTVSVRETRRVVLECDAAHCTLHTARAFCPVTAFGEFRRTAPIQLRANEERPKGANSCGLPFWLGLRLQRPLGRRECRSPLRAVIPPDALTTVPRYCHCPSCHFCIMQTNRGVSCHTVSPSPFSVLIPGKRSYCAQSA